jgi:phosphohistidine phosphatase
MGAALGDRYPPMTFYVSPAERAQGTFAGIKSQWAGLQVTHGSQQMRSIPLATCKLLEWIEQQSDEGSSLALIGHNPALTELIAYFAGRTTLDHLPTAGWAELAIDVESWSAIRLARGHGELVTNLLPRTLREAQ